MWVERCRVCFYPVPTRIFMQHAGRLKGWLLAVGWLAIPEHPHPFCPAVVDTSKAAVRQCFVWFLFFFNLFWCTEDLGRETDFLLLFFIFIPPSSGETQHLTNAVFSIHLPDYFFPLCFLVLGLNFTPILRLLFPDQPWEQEAGRGRRRFCLENVVRGAWSKREACSPHR